MKRLLFAVFLVFSSIQLLAQPTMTELVFPQYFGDLNSFRVKIQGLQPLTTYKMAAGMVSTDDIAYEGGPDWFSSDPKAYGYFYFPEYSGTNALIPSPFNAASYESGHYMTVPSDAAGEVTLWVVTAADNTADFSPEYYYPACAMRLSILINDGTSSEVIDKRILSPSTMILGDLTATRNSYAYDNCSVVKGISSASGGYVFTWDNVEGTGRPTCGSMIEDNNISETSAKITSSYRNQVNGQAGHYEIVQPLSNHNGIRRIEILNSDGTSRAFATSPDGNWPASGVNTASLALGSVYTINQTDASLPVELADFTAAIDGAGKTVNLFWRTATEINCHSFAVQKKIGTDWKLIGEVPARGTSNSPQSYRFTDQKAETGSNDYRLKITDNDGSAVYSQSASIEKLSPAVFSLSQNYPNPFNPATAVEYSLPRGAFVSVKIFNALGQDVATLVNEEQTAGHYRLNFDAKSLASGTYYCRLTAGPLTETKKMILMK